MEAEKIDFLFVEDAAQLDGVVSHLEKETEIGVDLEADSMYHYREKICLIQISTRSRNMIIDPLAVRDLSALARIFSNPEIRKVFHGADYDIRSLHRDFGIEVSSLFDTQLAAMFLGSKETGLASLLEDRFGVRMEKKYQKKDWSRRPLTEPMLNYAVRDSLFLLPLARMLEKELTDKGVLFCVREECDRLCKVRASQSDNNRYFLKYKGAGKLTPRSLTVLETVLEFRDLRARRLDRPPFKVLANSQVDVLVKEKPRNAAEIQAKQCLSPRQIKEFGHALAREIDRAMMLPKESLIQYPRKADRPIGDRVAKRIKTLKKWRERRAVEMGLDPSLICSNSQIKVLATLNPGGAGDPASLEPMKAWQIRLFGREIRSLLKE